MVARSPKSPTAIRRAAATIRPPLILEIRDSALIAGRVGSAPKHTEPLFGDPPLSSVEALYRYYIEPVRAVLYRVAPSIVEGTFVLVVSDKVVPNRKWQTAIAQCVLRDFCTAVSFVSTLHTIPIALAMVSPTLWVIEIQEKQENQQQAMQCMITAEDHALEYTYQSAHSNAPMEWVRALALSLLQCPILQRKAAIQNMVVVGTESSSSAKSKALAKSFHKFLLGESLAEKSPVDAENDSMTSNACYYAVDTAPLRNLASHIALVECRNGALAWTGASIWASRKAQDPSCWQKTVPEC